MVSFKINKTCPAIECPVVDEIIEDVVEDTIEEDVEVEEPQPNPIYFTEMKNFNFAPKELVIKVGSKVVFKNSEPALVHKLYERKGLFYGPRMNPGDSFNYTFETTGNFTIISIMGKDKGTKIDIEVID